MAEWYEKINQMYGLRVYHAARYNEGYVMETDQGFYLLMPAPPAAARKLPFIQRVYASLKKQQFSRVTPIRLAQKEKATFQWGKQKYYLTEIPDWVSIQGNPVPDGEWIARCLSAFHRATCRLNLSGFPRGVRVLGSWPQQWNARLDQLEKYRDHIAREWDVNHPLSVFLLPHYTYLCRLGETAIQYLEQADYHRVCRLNGQQGKVSYRGFHPRQHVIGLKDENVILLRPFDWLIDIRARDLGQCMKNGIFEQDWDDEQAGRFLAAYHQHHPLSREDMMIIYSVLMMPGRFIRKVEYVFQQRSGAHPADDTSGLEHELFLQEQMLRSFPDITEQATGIRIPRVSWL
ncbi:MAG: hypothetical protein H0Z33_07875 [Bacillaceae bacterium]|nr:hypothetical protein [Bacillaceae bacterium]